MTWRTRTGRLRRFIGRCLRAVGEGFRVYGGGDMYLAAAEGERARLEGLDNGFRLTLSADADGPPPGHPEKLCLDVPLSRQELLLLHDLLNEAPGFRT
ncbi:DUF6059 family protein [Streptomyces sp. PmtG]